MSFSESWRLLEDILVTDSNVIKNEGYSTQINLTGVRGSWVVLFGNKQRPLLIPVSRSRAWNKILNFFITNPLRLWYARIILRVNAICPWLKLLPVLTVPVSAKAGLYEALPFTQSFDIAILIGTSGPYQMASLLFVTEQGEGLGLAKVAMRQTADKSVQTEAYWLKQLQSYSDLKGKVPLLLAEGKIANGRHYLLTTLAHSHRVTMSFTEAHAEFLAALGRMQLTVTDFSSAPVCIYMRENCLKIAPHLDKSLREFINKALLDCEIKLVDWDGPFVVSQGDFAPWNIRYDREKIFVFDWEYATEGDNPLRDFFHFFLIQKAVGGKSISHKYMKELIMGAIKFSEYAYPEWNWNYKVVSAHLLAYMLHLILHYSESINSLDITHPVIKTYSQLIAERDLWI